MYIFPFCLSVLFVFIFYLFNFEGWFKGMSNLFLSCPAPKLLILAGNQMQFSGFQFSVVPICLFVYFTLILKVRMMMMMMKLSFFVVVLVEC